MSGSETIAYYCLDIFKRAKVTMMNNYTLSILLQTAFTTGYVISAFIINHVPRRIQFMSSAIFMAVSTATLGFTLNQSVEVCIPWVLSISLVQFIWFPVIFCLRHFLITVISITRTRKNTDESNFYPHGRDFLTFSNFEFCENYLQPWIISSNNRFFFKSGIVWRFFCSLK